MVYIDIDIRKPWSSGWVLDENQSIVWKCDGSDTQKPCSDKTINSHETILNIYSRL